MNIKKSGGVDPEYMSWGNAVDVILSNDQFSQLVYESYWDDPLIVAAERFYQSAEWHKVRFILNGKSGMAIDFGAGRGIASYALAKDGWSVCSLEPDINDRVGRGAISSLVNQTGFSIDVPVFDGGVLPVGDETQDLVYVRQVLHHLPSLSMFMDEAYRVLKRGGILLATREHVVTNVDEKLDFLAHHPLHALCGGENAYTVSYYMNAFRQSGFILDSVFGPYDTAINYDPMPEESRWRICCSPLFKIFGWKLTEFIANDKHAVGRVIMDNLAHKASHKDRTPGRLYTFMAHK